MRVQIDRPHKRYQATPLFLDLDVLPRAGDAVFIDGDDVDWEVSSVTWLLDDGDPLVRVSLLETRYEDEGIEEFDPGFLRQLDPGFLRQLFHR